MKNVTMKVLIPLLIVAGGFVAMKGLGKLKAPQQKHSRPPMVKSVKVDVVGKQTLRPKISALGRVRSEHPIQLAAEVAGTVMPAIFKFKSGAHFKKGQMLVSIDPRRADLQFKSSVSSLLNALASVLPEIKINLPDVFEKWNAFFGEVSFDHLPDLPEVTSSKEKLYLSRFNVYNLYFSARTMKITFEKHFLKAPFSGTVVKSNIRPGSMVGMGMTLGTIARTDKMEIEVPLSVADADWIDEKQPVAFTVSESGREYTGKVDRIARVMAGATQTISAYIAVDGKSSSGLLDGMYADIVFTGRELDGSFIIPRKAVVGKNKVFTVHEGQLKTVAVTIPRFGVDRVFLTGGVENGDTVVVEALQDAIEGMRVRVFGAKDAEKERTMGQGKKTKGEKGNRSGG